MEEFSVYANMVVRALNDSIIVSRISHWNVRGSNFYEAHKLFERVYDDLGGHMDSLIETLRSLGYNPDFKVFSGPDASLSNYDCHFLGNMVLEYVMTLSGSLSLFFEYLEAREGDPRVIGLSNHLQNISDSILTDMYLLQSYLGA